MTRKLSALGRKGKHMQIPFLLITLMMLLTICGTSYAESPNLDDLFTPENTILLANYIQELEAKNTYFEKENQRLQMEVAHLENSLAKERQLVIRLEKQENDLTSLMER